MVLYAVLVTVACLASVLTSSLNTHNKKKITTILNNQKRAEEGFCGAHEGATIGNAPGVEMMFKGVDLTQLDFYNRESFKLPVLDMTCKKGNTKAWNTQVCENKGSNIFAQPDQISSIYFDNSGSVDSSATVIESMSDIADSFSTSVSVSGSYGPVSGSASVSYSKMSRDIAENKYFYSIIEAKETTATYTIRADADLFPPANASLPWGIDYDWHDARSKRIYEDFIHKYGTHHFYVGFYGGVVRMVVKTDSSLTKRFTKSEIEAAASVKYNGLIASASVSVGVSKGQEKVNSEYNSNSRSTTKYYGGFSNLITKDGGLRKWQPSVRSNPYMMGGKLSPIYEKIKDPKMRENMEKATENYLKETYYGTLKTGIERFIRYFKHPNKDKILLNLRNFEATLVIGNPEDEKRTFKEVEKEYNNIMEELMPGCEPDWTEFEQNCYKFFGSKKTWNAASSACQSYGATLAWPRTKSENDFLRNLQFKAGNREWACWSGKKSGDLATGAWTNWKLSDDSKTYSCTGIRQRDGYWFGQYCTSDLVFICRK